MAKPVRCIETQQVFRTQTEAAVGIIEHLGIMTCLISVAGQISQHVTGKAYPDSKNHKLYQLKSVYGYHFERVNSDKKI